MKNIRPIIVITIISILSGISIASANNFSDVPTSHPYYMAIESLTQSGVLEGYEDGTFRPDKRVNRAEALKMILVSNGITINKGLFATGFPDVPLDTWYAGYVMEGLINGIIQGNPDGTFAGNRNVNKAEFLKMTLQTFEIDLSKHQNITAPIAGDVSPGDWFTPYLSYAQTVGLTYPTLENKLEPEKLLSRGECAQIIYKMALIKFGGQAQKMLAIAEAKLINALVYIYNNDIKASIKLADEALYYSELAFAKEPDSTAVQATKLISQAFQKLFFAYNAGIEESSAQIALFVNEAKSLADQAAEINDSASYFASKIYEHGDILIEQLIRLNP